MTKVELILGKEPVTAERLERERVDVVWQALSDDPSLPMNKPQTYEDDVTMPRALAVLCEEVLSSLSTRVPPSLDDDYELALAQLRVILK